MSAARRISMEDPPTERYNPDDEPEEDIEHVQDQGAVTSKVCDLLRCQVLCFCCCTWLNIISCLSFNICIHFLLLLQPRGSQARVIDTPINMEDGPTLPDRRLSDMSAARRISMEDPPTERYNPDDEPEEDIEHVQDQGAVTSKVCDFLRCQVLCFCCCTWLNIVSLCLFQYMHTFPVALTAKRLAS